MKQTLPAIILFLVFNLFLGPVFQLSAQTCTVTASANSTVICEEQPVILTGNASYEVSSWKWYREGETTPVSTLRQYQTNIAGKYKLIASGGECGDVESSIIELSKVAVPVTPGAISGPSQVCLGGEATYQVNSVEGADGYIWSVPADWQIIRGQGTPSIIVIAGSTTGYIAVRAIGLCGASPEVGKLVTIPSAIANNTISSDQFVCQGQTPMEISGTLPTGGTGVYTYLWESSVTGPDEGFVVAAGVNNGQNYHPQMLWQTTWFRRKVVVGCYQSISNAVKVTLAPAPAKPTANDVSIAYGESATLTVVSPQPSIMYRWFTTVAGGSYIASGATYTTSALTANNTYYVEAVSVNGCVSERTTVAVTVNTKIENNIIGADQSVCVGQAPAVITGTVPSGGNGTYTYQWERSEDGLGFIVIPGATAKDYTPGVLNQTTWFRRRISAGSGEYSISNSIKITVLTTPAAPVVEPINVCAGYSAKLKVRQPNPEYTYRWYLIGREDEPLEGAAITTVPITADTVYFVEAVNAAGCVSPRTKYEVRLVLPFSSNNVGEAQEICAGEVPALLGGMAPQNGSMRFEYFWEASTDGVNYTPAPNENDSKYYQPEALTQTTWFRRSAVSEFCPLSVSEPVKITVLPLPDKPSINHGATTLTASVAGANYEWLKDGQVLSAAKTQSITVDGAGAYRVRVQSEQGCYSEYSDALQITLLSAVVAKEASEAGITAAPNPTRGQFMLHTQLPLKQVQIEVLDPLGKLVYSKKIEYMAGSQPIDLSHLKAGLYLVHVKAEKLQAVQRLVVAK